MFNAIFDKGHAEILVPMGFWRQQFVGDSREFLTVCPNDKIKKIIIYTHVGDDGVILTWRAMYDEVLLKWIKRYPGTIDEFVMDRYGLPLRTSDRILHSIDVSFRYQAPLYGLHRIS